MIENATSDHYALLEPGFTNSSPPNNGSKVARRKDFPHKIFNPHTDCMRNVNPPGLMTAACTIHLYDSKRGREVHEGIALQS